MIQACSKTKGDIFMGTSILLVFIIPAMIFEVLFSFITGAMFGYPTAKVELPYDEATGLVWEYDNVDDPYVKLSETEIKDGKQIFYFESAGIEISTDGEMMDLVFTDKNGNEEVYYCVTSAKINEPGIYSADECRLMEITLTATNPEEGGKWIVTENGNYILNQESTVSETQTYTVVVTPGNKRGNYAEYGMFDVKFAYTNSLGVPEELVTAVYKYENGEHYLHITKYETVDNFLDKLFGAVFDSITY